MNAVWSTVRNEFGTCGLIGRQRPVDIEETSGECFQASHQLLQCPMHRKQHEGPDLHAVPEMVSTQHELRVHPRLLCHMAGVSRYILKRNFSLHWAMARPAAA